MAVRLKRVVLVAGMTHAALNVWTGAPLAGLWVGSRLTGGERITVLAVFATVAVIGFFCWTMMRSLAWVASITTASPGVRRRSSGTRRGCAA